MSIRTFPITDRKTWLSHRQPDVTASVAAALFGEHPYQTRYGLYCLKAGLIKEDPEDTPLFKRGRLLEPVAIELLREDRPDWEIIPNKHYYRDETHRIGATPDVHARRPDIEGPGIVQIKTAGKFAFDKGWKGESGEVNLPLWIAIQASIEAALTGSTWASVAVMALGDGGLDLRIIDVPIKPKLIAKLHELAADFWRRVDEKDPYSPDFSKDLGVISRLYADDDGSSIDLSNNAEAVAVVDERERLKAIEKAGGDAEKLRKQIDGRIIAILGNATTGYLADGRTIEAKTIRRVGFTVAPTSFRTLKIKETS